MIINFVFAFLCLLLLVGCGAKFSCTENLEGIKCDPPSKVYELYLRGETSKVSSEVTIKDRETTELANSLVPKNINKPIRVPPKVIKIWIAPWEDSAGDLHSGEEIYSELAPVKGRWILGEKEDKNIKLEIENNFKDIGGELPEKIIDESKAKGERDTSATQEKKQDKEQQPKIRKSKTNE